ncbi:hypothetical protein HSBAA_32450 [Vreelandella sulfidaeris]|uniref:FAD/NAD(P)-binding domain-containing protein n=1 Tax=Vreelandella sulfidaeris TaxID=115553 RepID=A0A455UBN5_9GAMM|nr:hypothetical protein HSBAA_32450 [Halomonas sulfidaeris]
MNLHFNKNIERIEATPEAYNVHLTNGEVLEVDVVLAATGRKANIKDLGLEALGLDLNEQGKIPVNERFETAIPSVLALGDLIAGPELTPVALAEAHATC